VGLFQKLCRNWLSQNLAAAEAIGGLMEAPNPNGARKIKGDLFGDEFDYYRIRVGHYRVIYTVDEESYDVLVARVRHRRDAHG
jgi:mRNA interferase RelE/StbE